MGLRAAFFASLAILILTLLWKVLNLPTDSELEVIARNAFSSYGFWIIIVAAYIEALLLIGMYFPGSLVIFLGVIFATGMLEATLAVFYTTVGLYAGYVSNYFLGKYGWYRVLSKCGLEEKLVRLRERVERRELSYLFFTFWSPSTAALTATVAGIIQVNFKRFLVLSLCTVLTWNVFWGTLVYSLGESALTLVGFKFLIVFIALGLFIEILVSHLRKKV